MRSTFLLLIIVCLLSCSDNNNKKTAQPPRLQLKDTSIAGSENHGNPYAPVDLSPMDMSYYPVDYPKLKMTGSAHEPLIARVIYSRPHLQGRSLFHGLLNYGQPWRLGANEATEIQLFKDVTIGDKKVNEGRYMLYVIPQQETWTLVFNKNIDTWGLKPDSTQDAYRFNVPVIATDNRIEYFTMIFEKAGAGASLLMAWDNLEARLRITF